MISRAHAVVFTTLLVSGCTESGPGLVELAGQKALALPPLPQRTPNQNSNDPQRATIVPVRDELKARMGAPHDSLPQVMQDARGDRVAVWRASDGTHYNLWANHFHRGAWGIPHLIESNPDDVGQAHLAIDANGNGLVVWDQPAHGTHLVWAARYRKGAGWEAPQVISSRGANGASHASAARVVLDGTGNAVVTWRQVDDKWFARLWTNRYSPAAGWAEPTPLDYQ